jgi:hypothetical protein
MEMVRVIHGTAQKWTIDRFEISEIFAFEVENLLRGVECIQCG